MTVGSPSLLAIDDGGYSVNVVYSEHNKVSFPSVKGYVKEETNLLSVTGDLDFIVQYEGKRFVAGELGLYDNPLKLQMHTKSKCNLFFDLSVLIAVFKYGRTVNKVAVSVPIKMYNKDEIEGRKNRLEGSHTLTINDVTKTFYIEEVRVAPESAIAFWVNQDYGKTHYIDLGSRTIGIGTTINENGKYRFIDSESDTLFSVGLQALGDKFTPKSLADYIGGLTLSYLNPNNKVYFIGGGANNPELIAGLREYYPNGVVMQQPEFANAIGMYRLMKGVYGVD